VGGEACTVNKFTLPHGEAIASLFLLDESAVALLAQNSGQLFLQLVRRKRIASFPHIDIGPDQMVLADSHATHDTNGDGFAIHPGLCANITVHVNPSCSIFGMIRVSLPLQFRPNFPEVR
jgi:hypothetical protein